MRTDGFCCSSAGVAIASAFRVDDASRNAGTSRAEEGRTRASYTRAGGCGRRGWVVEVGRVRFNSDLNLLGDEGEWHGPKPESVSGQNSVSKTCTV